MWSYSLSVLLAFWNVVYLVLRPIQWLLQLNFQIQRCLFPSTSFFPFSSIFVAQFEGSIITNNHEVSRNSSASRSITLVFRNLGLCTFFQFSSCVSWEPSSSLILLNSNLQTPSAILSTYFSSPVVFLRVVISWVHISWKQIPGQERGRIVALPLQSCENLKKRWVHADTGPCIVFS